MKHWDVFISHASPDKESFVTPLAEALHATGVRVWLDRWTIELGDSISESISEGLTKSRFGVVVLSKAFFARAWPKKELGALFAKESSGASHIIPLWHQVEYSDVWKHAPLLADRMAARSDEGIPSIVERILRLLARDSDKASGLTPNTLRSLTKRLFPELPVDEFWQTMLLADLDSELYHSVGDIELAYRRAKLAVEAYAKEQPGFFKSGTDYLTKALGFVNLCFRSRHNWSPNTEYAFQKYAHWVIWDVKVSELYLSSKVNLADETDLSEVIKAPSDGSNRDVTDQLFSKTYEELEELARRFLRRNAPNVSLNPCELVSETYLKLTNANMLLSQERNKFFSIAARAMRKILLDHATKYAECESGKALSIEGLSKDLGTTTTEDLILLDEALNRLMSLDPVVSRVLEFRYFGGLSIEDISVVLSISPATVSRHLMMAKAWLARELGSK